MQDNEQNEPMRGFDDFVVSLGDELRGERATRGKSLLDVQRDLRIKASYIAAIENCDPSVFPNQGFVAGYVRSYARYLNLEPDAMFARFARESGFKGVNADLIPDRAQRKDRAHAKRLKGAELAPKFAGSVMPRRDGLLDTVSPSGIASVMVLVCLISGLGFGGWWIINDIQRVEFAPVDQAPGVIAAVTTVDTPKGDESSDLALAIPTQTRNEASILDRLYRPQELAIPRMEPRDGPIAAIDPDSVGVLRQISQPIETTDRIADLISETVEFQGPVVTVADLPPQVELLATRAAWVRVYQADGTVLFEKILEKGERYSVPIEAEAPLLRAGNAGSVYLVINNEAFGPVGNGTSVAKKVSLASVDVREQLQIAADVTLDAEPVVSTAENQ